MKLLPHDSSLARLQARGLSYRAVAGRFSVHHVRVMYRNE